MQKEHWLTLILCIVGLQLIAALIYALATADSVYRVERCSYELDVVKVVPYEPEEASYFCYRESEEEVELVYDPALRMTMPKTVTHVTTYGCQRKPLKCPR